MGGVNLSREEADAFGQCMVRSDCYRSVFLLERSVMTILVA